MPALLRAANGKLFGYLADADVREKLKLHDAIHFAYANIPADRSILERIVHAYASNWDLRKSDYAMTAMDELPLAFTRRLMFHLQELSTLSEEDRKKRKRHCCLNHASEEEKQKCNMPHMRYDDDLGIAIWE